MLTYPKNKKKKKTLFVCKFLRCIHTVQQGYSYIWRIHAADAIIIHNIWGIFCFQQGFGNICIILSTVRNFIIKSMVPKKSPPVKSNQIFINKQILFMFKVYIYLCRLELIQEENLYLTLCKILIITSVWNSFSPCLESVASTLTATVSPVDIWAL